MAALPASKAYFRGGPPRRVYVKGAPLFATQVVKFNGVGYPRGAALPIADMKPRKHWELWFCGKATHQGPKPAPSTSIAPTPVVTTSADELAEAELEKLTAPAADTTDKRRGKRR